MALLAHSLLILGSCLLITALRPVWKLILQLPSGQIQNLWKLLSILIYIFIAGYIVYSFVLWGEFNHLTDLIVPTIFFFGAIFVLLVSALSLSTTNDVKRVLTLEYESTTDSLMGVYNRRYLEKRLQEEFVRSKRYQFPLSILLLDIDHFKSVNDHWGHPVGDIVLKNLAALITEKVRDSDVVARYGGEEILIILPHTKESNAMILAERLRQAIEFTELVKPEENDQRSSIKITVSLGVAAQIPAMTAYQQLIKQADKALYFAKERGRNRVVKCEKTDSEDC